MNDDDPKIVETFTVEVGVAIRQYPRGTYDWISDRMESYEYFDSIQDAAEDARRGLSDGH